MDTGATWIDGDLLRCSFCGRPQQRVAKLIAATSSYICDGCVAQARSWKGVEDPGRRCGFCGQPRARLAFLVARGDGEICGECLDLCEEIIAEEQAG